jgi:hypothetical protein
VVGAFTADNQYSVDPSSLGTKAICGIDSAISRNSRSVKTNPAL